MRSRMGSRRAVIIVFASLLVLMTGIGALFVMSTWRYRMEMTEKRAIALAEAAESGMSKADLAEWLSADSPADHPMYSEIKSNLMLLAHMENDIEFAYIYINKHGTIHIMADSEPEWSMDYSPPGQIYHEANYQFSIPFYTGETVLTDVTTDRWGRWISVLVPIVHPDTGKVIAVLGVDYPADTWMNEAVGQTVRSGLIAVCAFLFLCAVLIVLEKNATLRLDKQELATADARLRESERSKSILLDNLPGLVYRCQYDRDWTMLFVSQGCYQMTGYPAESLLGNRDLSFNDLIAPEYQDLLWKKWAQVVSKNDVLEEEYQITTASGECKWVWEQGQAVYDEAGNVVALEGLILDIDSRKRNELQLRYLYEHDPLTGLYNRRSLEEAIGGELTSVFTGTKAIVFVNIRKFNLINLTYGYQYGETVVQEMAACLSKLSDESHRLYQVSIDRFAFLCNKSDQRPALEEFCRKIGREMAESPLLGTVQANAGVVEYRAGSLNVANILRNAMIAAGNASESHRFSYCFFSADMEEKVERESRIKEELFRTAADPGDESLYLAFQPIYHLAQRKVYAFEALARYRSEQLGDVNPSEFIPIAEESQLIIPLGFRILRKACGFIGTLTRKGYDDIAVSVNVSVLQLLRDDFLPIVLKILNDTGTDPNRLILEITESIYLHDNADIKEKFGSLREMGFRIAIDDFGTGYSSLARERELPVDCLKIDKYFIDKLMTVEHSQAITGDIISMAHKLGHTVVAEGVELERQKQYLEEYHCDMIQGYIYSRPLPEEDAVSLLSEI